MRKFRPGCFTVCALLFATLWGTWSLTPRLRYQQELAGILAERPRPLPKFPEDRKLDIGEMVLLGTVDNATNKHLPQLIGDKNPKFIETCRNFETRFQQLHEQLKSAPTYGGWVYGIVRLESGLAAYAEVLRAQGKDGQVQEVAIDSLRLAGKVGVANGAGSFEARYQAQKLAVDTAEYALSRTNWDAPRLKSLAAALEESVIPDELASHCLREEIAVNSSAVPKDKNNIPGLQARQLRVYQNRAIDTLHQLKANHLLPLNTESQAPTRKWFETLLGAPDWSDLDRLPFRQRQVEALKDRQALDHLWVYLQLYHLEKGRWPDSLTQLQPIGYKPLGGFDATRVQMGTAADGNLELSCPLRVEYYFCQVSSWAGVWEVKGQNLKIRPHS